MKLGMVASAFDPFPHPGVIWAMQQGVAAYELDGIMAAVHVDPSIERPQKRKPSMPLNERTIMVQAIRFVSKVFVYDSEASLRDMIANEKPVVLIVGEDHRGDAVTGSDLVEVFYAVRKAGWSGSEFLKLLREGRPLCQCAS